MAPCGTNEGADDWPRLKRGFFVRRPPRIGRSGPYTQHRLPSWDAAFDLKNRCIRHAGLAKTWLGRDAKSIRESRQNTGRPHHGLLSSSARPAKKYRRATSPAAVAVCSVLNPSSRSRAGSGSPSRQISQLRWLSGIANAVLHTECQSSLRASLEALELSAYRARSAAPTPRQFARRQRRRSKAAVSDRPSTGR
jgi:hypothetical protein